jgi:four helix bundle protein
MTKEARNPNDECGADEADRSDFEFWGLTPEADIMVLRDGPEVNQRVFDLEDRTTRFGEDVIRFAKKIPQNPVNNRLIDQLVGAGTSIGANYCEADDGVTKKDFLVRIGTCKKEARETKFFLRMVATAEEGLKSEARELWKEARELHLIFCAIWRRGRGNG